MLSAGSFSDSGNRFLQHLLAEFAHLSEDVSEVALVGNGFFVQRSLRWRKGQANGPGFDLACQSPGSRGLRHDTPLGDPSQVQQLFL
jgi:hypothetical protein